jgi:ribosomal protein S18 acetylase RimI-like enzyme
VRQKYNGALEFRRLNIAFEQPLLRFLQALVDAGDTAHFQPHAFTPEYVATLVRYAGDDLYYLLVEGDGILSYGMLRGWDEGFSIPSLGIAVHPSARGQGLGRLMMNFLHAAARRRNSSTVRLRVAVENETAAALYESMGYRFTQVEGRFKVGFLELRSARFDQV